MIKGQKRAQKVAKRKKRKPGKQCPSCGFRHFDGKRCRSGVVCKMHRPDST